MNMISEDLISTESLLKELIVNKDKQELYKNIATSNNMINIQSIDLNSLDFDDFSIALKWINFNQVADLITDNLKVKNKLLVFTIFKDILSNTSTKQKQEDYFHQICKNFFICILDKKYKKELIKEKIKVENLKLIIQICFKLDYYNNYVDEVIKYISTNEQLLIQFKDQLKLMEQNIEGLIENSEDLKEKVIKNNTNLKLKRSGSTEISRNCIFMESNITSKKSKKVYNKTTSLNVIKNSNNLENKQSNKIEKVFNDKKSLLSNKIIIDNCAEINNEHSEPKIQGNYKTCDFDEKNRNTELNKTNVCNLSDLRTTYKWKNPIQDQKQNLFLKKETDSISSYKVKLNPNPINRNTVNIADNNQKIKYLTSNHLKFKKSENRKFYVKVDSDNLSIEDSMLIERINPLLEGTEIYKRIYFTNSSEISFYSPITCGGSNPINYGFVENFVYMDKSLQQLVFRKAFSDEKNCSAINLSSIERIEVSKEMMDVVTIFQLKNHLNDTRKILERIRIKNEVNKTFFSEEKISLCLNNQYFLLSLIVKNGNRLEFVFKGYNIYKYWLNGLNTAIKDKEKLAKMNIYLVQKSNYIV